MNFLQVVQRAALVCGIPAPSVAVQSTDGAIQQLVELVHLEGEDLSSRYEWQALRREATWTADGTGEEGALEDLAPNFSRMIGQTFWDRSRRWRVNGPLSPEQWQQVQSLRSPSVGPYYRIFGNQIHTFPVLPNGNQAVFEYIQRYWLYNGTTDKEFATDDSDELYLDSQAVALGAIWRWKQAKGLTYDEDFRSYEYRVNMVAGRDGSKPVVSLSGNPRALPGLNIPDRGWVV